MQKNARGAGERKGAPIFGFSFFPPPPPFPRSCASYFHLAESIAQANLENVRNEKIDEV